MCRLCSRYRQSMVQTQRIWICTRAEPAAMISFCAHQCYIQNHLKEIESILSFSRWCVVPGCSAKKQIVPQAFRPSHPSGKPCGSGINSEVISLHFETKGTYEKRDDIECRQALTTAPSPSMRTWRPLMVSLLLHPSLFSPVNRACMEEMKISTSCVSTFLALWGLIASRPEKSAASFGICWHHEYH